MDGSPTVVPFWKHLSNLDHAILVFFGELDGGKTVESQFVKSDDTSMQNSFDTSSVKIGYMAYLHRTAPLALLV